MSNDLDKLPDPKELPPQIIEGDSYLCLTQFVGNPNNWELKICTFNDTFFVLGNGSVTTQIITYTMDEKSLINKRDVFVLDYITEKKNIIKLAFELGGLDTQEPRVGVMVVT